MNLKKLISEVINIEIIKDIIAIIKNDERHHIKLVIDDIYFTVYLDDDQEETYEEKYLIPIRYDSCIGSCYIPHDEYCEIMHDNDFGIDIEEINLIQKIMQYMEDNKDAFDNVCKYLSINGRKTLKEKAIDHTKKN